MQTESTNWHALTVAQTLEKLGVNLDKGLDTREIGERQAKYGKNIFATKKEKPLILKFLHQFNQAFIYILIAAGAVKAFLGEWVNAGVIWGVTTTNAVISFIQESRAEGAIAALAKSVVTEATVLREGQKLRLPSAELVVGDVVLLSSGDKVPADLRLCQVRDLQINESGLTGESVPVEKIAEVLEPEAPVADRDNMAHAGVAAGVWAPAFLSSLAYYDGYRSAWLPANLLQAQRDYFGAHTYERTDRSGVFHTPWKEGCADVRGG